MLTCDMSRKSKFTRDPIAEGREELEKLFKDGKYDTFKRRVRERQFDLLAHFKDAKEPFMHKAACENNVEMIDYLVKAGFEIDQANDRGWTPLYEATLNGVNHVTEAVDALYHYGADINFVSQQGLTPLHHAVCGDNIPLIRQLIRYGADPFIKTSYGLGDPLTYAGYQREQYFKFDADDPDKKQPEAIEYFGRWIEFKMDKYQAYRRGREKGIEKFMQDPANWQLDLFPPFSGAEIFALEKSFDAFVSSLTDPHSTLKSLRPSVLKIAHKNGQLGAVFQEGIWPDLPSFEKFCDSLGTELKKDHTQDIYEFKAILLKQKMVANTTSQRLKRRPVKGPKR